MRVVIDTNIIVAAAVSPSGGCFSFFNRVMAGDYEVFVTKEILAEYDEVLHRDKFQLTEDEIDFFLGWFKRNAQLVEVNENDYTGEGVPDKKDIPFYIAAKATRSRLVTGNIKHYPIEEMRTMLWEVL